MSDYILVNTGTGTWLNDAGFTATLTRDFPGTTFETGLLPGSSISIWAYLPDEPAGSAGLADGSAGLAPGSAGRTGEVTVDQDGGMVGLTDISRELAARVIVRLAQTHPAPDGEELQLWMWAEEPITITAQTTETELLV
jgi:hypothetical protein